MRPSPPFLEASLVAQLGPQPELHRGVNASAGPTFNGEAMGWGVGKKLGAVAAGAPPAAVVESTWGVGDLVALRCHS